jgi:predicted SAM-dependent methyltransferase
MRYLGRQILTRTHLLEFARWAYRNYYRFKRKIRRTDRSIIEQYFSIYEARRLHIGCGSNIIDGWLNSDFYPHSVDILHLDATDILPFENGVFDYVFSEHMIEHVSYPNGFAMLKECNRVLKNNGRIRISTPDLQFLIDLYRDKKSDLQIEYIKFDTERFVFPYQYEAFVINNFVRAWGHLFIYDEKTLRTALKEAGFTNIVRCELNESEDEALQNLENEKRLPSGFLKLQSFTLEGTKSLDS